MTNREKVGDSCFHECPYRLAAQTAIDLLDENLGSRFDAEDKQRKLGELTLLMEVIGKAHTSCEGPSEANNGNQMMCPKRGFVNDVMSLIVQQSPLKVNVPNFDQIG